MRTCLGCGQRADKTDLVRVVAVKATTVVVPDLRGSAEGRGAHMHPTIQCFERAKRRKAFGRALRIAGTPDLSMLSTFVEDEQSNTASKTTK